MAELEHHTLDLLKMDIEGAEYAVLDDLLQSSIRPLQLVVEFHHDIHKLGWERTKAMLERLREAGYVMIYVSRSRHQYTFLLR